MATLSAEISVAGRRPISVPLRYGYACTDTEPRTYIAFSGFNVALEWNAAVHIPGRKSHHRKLSCIPTGHKDVFGPIGENIHINIYRGETLLEEQSDASVFCDVIPNNKTEGSPPEIDTTRFRTVRATFIKCKGGICLDAVLYTPPH